MRINNITTKNITIKNLKDQGEPSNFLAYNSGVANISRIKYVNGYFFAFGLFLGQVRYSLDGQTWLSLTLPQNWVIAGDILHDGTKYVIAASGGYVFTSDDLSSIQNSYTVSGSDNVQNASIVYNPDDNIYVYTGSLGADARIFTSNNLSSWTSRTVPTPTILNRSIIYGNGRYIMKRDGNNVLISTDSINWTNNTVASSINSKDFSFYNNKFYNISSNKILETTDGITYNQYGANPLSNYSSLVMNTDKGSFLCGQNESAQFIYSDYTFGKSFTGITGYNGSCGAYGNGIYILGGGTGTNVYVADTNI